MRKNIQSDMDDELRSEYDLRELLKSGVRGKYVERYDAGTNLVLMVSTMQIPPLDLVAQYHSIKIYTAAADVATGTTVRPSTPLAGRRPAFGVACGEGDQDKHRGDNGRPPRRDRHGRRGKGLVNFSHE